MNRIGTIVKRTVHAGSNQAHVLYMLTGIRRHNYLRANRV